MSNSLKDLEAMHICVKEFRTITKDNREVLLRILNKDHAEIGDRVDEPFSEIKERYMQGDLKGQKIQAIKMVREVASQTNRLTYYGLKEAKDLVESW